MSYPLLVVQPRRAAGSSVLLAQVVPAAADLKKVPFVEEWWHTDGVSVWRDGGPKLTGRAAGDALRKSFEIAAAKLPFRAVGDRRVTVRVQVPGKVAMRDLLSGERLDVVDGAAKLTVPAGCLRILDAVK